MFFLPDSGSRQRRLSTSACSSVRQGMARHFWIFLGEHRSTGILPVGNRASRLVDSLPVRPVAGKMPAPALQPRWLCCLPPSAATTRNAPEEPVMLSYPGGL